MAIELGYLADAQRFLDECLPLAQQIGDRWLIGATYCHQAMLAHVQGELVRAASAYQRAITIFQELRLLWDLCVVQVFLGEVQIGLGDTALARQTILAGPQLALRTGSVPTVLAALLDLAMLPDAEALAVGGLCPSHPVKTKRLIRDTERLWAELTARSTPAQSAERQALAQSTTLETLVAAL